MKSWKRNDYKSKLSQWVSAMLMRCSSRKKEMNLRKRGQLQASLGSIRCCKKELRSMNKNWNRPSRRLKSANLSCKRDLSSTRRSWMTLETGIKRCVLSTISKSVSWGIKSIWKLKTYKIREKKSLTWRIRFHKSRMSSSLFAPSMLWFNKGMKSAWLNLTKAKQVTWNKFQNKTKVPLTNWWSNKMN